MAEDSSYCNKKGTACKSNKHTVTDTTYSADMDASMTHAINHTNRIDVEKMPLNEKSGAAKMSV